MTEPAEPQPAPHDPDAAAPDDEASLTVDQVSEDPPDADFVLASPCRDALVQSAPCALSRNPPSVTGASPLTATPPSAAPASLPARSVQGKAGPRSAAAPSSRSPKLARVSRAAQRAGIGKGELASLDGGGASPSELLAVGCSERGPRLVVAGPQFDSIDGAQAADDDDDSNALSIPVALSEPPPVASPARSARPPAARTPRPAGASAASDRAGAALTLASASAASATLAGARGTQNRRITLNGASDAPGAAADALAASVRGAAPSNERERQESPAGAKKAPQGPIGLISDFDEPLALDPRPSRGVPLKPPPLRPRRKLPPRFLAIFGGLFGLTAIGTLLAVLIQLDTGKNAAPAASSARPAGKAPAAAKASAPAEGSARAQASAAPPEPPEPGPWRVSTLSSDENVKMISGKLGTRSLMVALEDEHVPKPQIFRILKAFDDAKLFDKPKKSHQYVVALERGSKRVKGFEYQASTTEVWQAREVEDGKLVGQKLDLKIEQRRISKGVNVSADLKSALVEAGLDDDMVGLLDDSIGDRISIERLGKGASLRLVAQEQLAAGRFSKYLALDAIEYRTPRSDKKVRVYHFRNGKISGFFDAAGKAPFRSSWGPPLKVVRVTSRFNPKRMHPVLHTIMPHNGTDFGAPMGTPVYAVAAGTVAQVGPQGPSGNLVLIEHQNALESGYAHLSRFAQGLKKGDKVEAQQLVGYVGSTGRSTGPHLHFSMKKNGVFIDALTVIKLNQERVIPKAERADFDAFRAEMDKLLDAIPLADPPPAGEAGPDPDDNDKDENNHDNDDGDEHPAPAASADPNGKPAPDAKPEPPPAPPVTDSSTPESAVWRPDLSLRCGGEPAVGRGWRGREREEAFAPAPPGPPLARGEAAGWQGGFTDHACTSLQQRRLPRRVRRAEATTT